MSFLIRLNQRLIFQYLFFKRLQEDALNQLSFYFLFILKDFLKALTLSFFWHVQPKIHNQLLTIQIFTRLECWAIKKYCIFKNPKKELNSVTGTQKKLGFWVGFWVFPPTRTQTLRNPKNPKSNPTPNPKIMGFWVSKLKKKGFYTVYFNSKAFLNTFQRW